MEKIDFKKNKYNIDLILDAYDLKRSVQNCAVLRHLVETTGSLSKQHAEYLEEHRVQLEQEGDFWNEEELKMRFLAHIFAISNIDEPHKIKIFYERVLKDEVNGHDVYVKCDCMVASQLGVNTPKAPYFFLQEFKKAKNPDDPEGQMLLAMVAAQHLNDNGKPVYGCWLQGKNWTFAALYGKQYCVGRQYDASISEDLHQILYILRNLKTIILSELL